MYSVTKDISTEVKSRLVGSAKVMMKLWLHRVATPF